MFYFYLSQKRVFTLLFFQRLYFNQRWTIGAKMSFDAGLKIKQIVNDCNSTLIGQISG